MAIDLEKARQELAALQRDAHARNVGYDLNRKAVQGVFRRPKNWPEHIDFLVINLCKPIVERFVGYVMGRGFTFNVRRPNTLEHRTIAEVTEKILQRLVDLSNGPAQFIVAAIHASSLGRAIFKVYETGPPEGRYASFCTIVPDHFYGIFDDVHHRGALAKAYYTYAVDIDVAKARWGDRPYSTGTQTGDDMFAFQPRHIEPRQVTVTEYWTKDSYALTVGGVVVFNGRNPFRDLKTEEGYVPFVVVDNIRHDDKDYGESDIDQARLLNEKLNLVVSRRVHMTNRWLQPTLVWVGAPQNYAELLRETLQGGGVLPTRPNSNLYFLSHDKEFRSITDTEAFLRSAIMEVAGLNEFALHGTLAPRTSGTAAETQFTPFILNIQRRRAAWTVALQRLFYMLLDTQERIGDSTSLGEAVINERTKSEEMADGEVVQLSGTQIGGLREAEIFWPDVLQVDDMVSKQFELSKFQAGVQSLYRTLENLGEPYPDDELARIRMEKTDPALLGEPNQAPEPTDEMEPPELEGPDIEGIPSLNQRVAQMLQTREQTSGGFSRIEEDEYGPRIV